MKESLLLVDGSSILSTSFFGNMPKEYYKAKTDEEKSEILDGLMKTSTGIYTNAVYTFCSKLLKIRKEQNPTHLAVAWDISRDTFRRDIYPFYKANRDETLPQLKSQFGLMQEVLDTMGVKQFMVKKKEADDILGTLAKMFEEQIPTFILTKDQDALQLVNEFTRLWLYTSKAEEMYCQIPPEFKVGRYPYGIPDGTFEFTPLWVKQFYGVEPIQIIDMKALGGDKSDNIPGVAGVGEKTIVPLLNEYKTIENLYDHIENLTPTEEKEMKAFFKTLGIVRSPLSYLLKKPHVKKELVGKDAALLSKKLATIDRDIEELQTVELDSLKFEIDEEGMYKKFEKLEFKSLLEKRSA